MEILNHILTLTGVEQGKIDEIMSNDALKGVSLPDDIKGKVKQSLITIDGAKQHPDIANHFKGTHFGVIDAALKSSMSEAGFSDDEINDLFSGKKSNERVKDAIGKAIEAGRKTASKTGNEQLEELRGLLQTKEGEYKTKLQQLHEESKAKSAKMEAFMFDIALSDAIAKSGLKLKDLDKEILDVSSRHLINSKLQELKAVPKVVNGKIQLFRQDDPESPHFTGATATDFASLIPEMIDSLVEKKQTKKENTITIAQNGSTSGLMSAKSRVLQDIKSKI